MLRLAYIGGLGFMAGPAAGHLKPGGPAKVLRVHDRGTPGTLKDEYRQGWRDHGASLVSSLETLVGDGDLDGIVICCGKNGDDATMLGEVASLLGARTDESRPFIIHMSTVSAGFAVAAHSFCAGINVDYVNFPLTGGPLGAQLGGGHANGMLILASGDTALYQRLEPLLTVLGRPKYYGPSVPAGAETKLIGHHLVFNGLIGISAGVALQAACFTDGAIGGAKQSDYFDFLNGGAGGTRQWDVAMSKGIKDDNWSGGFLIKHAVVDAIYAAQLAQDKGLSRMAVQPMIGTALSFAFLLEKYPDVTLATHAVVREMIGSAGAELDAFMMKQGVFAEDVNVAIGNCIRALPAEVEKTVLLNVSVADFG